MDSFQFLMYTLGRIAVMLAAIAFGVMAGTVLYPAVTSLLPDGSLRTSLMSETLRSVISYLVIAAMLIPVFFDDGKKHAAYEIWSSVNITITLLFMAMICFIPSIFRDSFEPEGKANAFYKIAYFPYIWFGGSDFVAKVLVGVTVMTALLLVTYVLSFKHYARLHPVILRPSKPREEEADTEEDDTEDMN